MNKNEIKSVWAAFLEVQEAKKKALDPVGKEDGDVDNDGDEDSSDEYLANRRKKVGAAVKKESSEESPYPSLDKKKREKKGSNLEDAGGPAAKLKGEAVEKGKKVVCPKCKGDGCDHCDGEGEHVKEDYIAFVESLDDEDLAEYTEWLLEEEELDELSANLLNRADKAAANKSHKHHQLSKKRANTVKKIEKSAGGYDNMSNKQKRSAEKADDSSFDHGRKANKAASQSDKFAAASAKKRANESTLDELSTDLLNRAGKAASDKSRKHNQLSNKRANTVKKIEKSAGGYDNMSHKQKRSAEKADDSSFDHGRKADKAASQSNKFAAASAKRANESTLDELSKDTYRSARDKATASADGNRHFGNDKKADKRERQAGKFATAAFNKTAHGHAQGHPNDRGKKKANESNMDRYVDALRSIPNDQIDELSAALVQRAADKAKKREGQQSKLANKTADLGTAHSAKAKSAKAGGHTDKHAKHAEKSREMGNKRQGHIDKGQKAHDQKNKFNAAARKKSMGENAFDIINSVFEMRDRSRLESVLSPAELAAIEEKMQPNSSGTKSEPFMSTSSAGEKKFYADHEKGSEKKYEDWEETGEKDAVKAGRGVKSQSPTRRGEKRQSETMSKVK